MTIYEQIRKAMAHYYRETGRDPKTIFIGHGIRPLFFRYSEIVYLSNKGPTLYGMPVY